MSVFDRPLLTGKQVATGLRVTPDWFYRHREELRRRGFPAPVIHQLYDARAVHAWMDLQMPAKLRAQLEGAAIARTESRT